MNFGIITSVIFHILILLLIYFGIPSFAKKLPNETAISVEILPVKAISNVPNKTNQQQPTKEESKTIVKASNNDTQNKLEIKEKAEAKDDTKITKKEIIPEPKEIIKTQVPNKNSLKEAKKDKPKDLPKDKPKEQNKDNKKIDKVVNKKAETKPKAQNSELDSLLKTLDVPSDKKTKDAKANKQNSGDKRQNSKSDKEFDELQPLSLSEEASIRSQLYKCWEIPIGIKDIAKMSVVLNIKLAQDGTVTHVKIIEENKPSKGDISAFQVFGESAVRAVHKCSPLQNLPIERYNVWQEIELNFDPRDVVN
ncbi:Periplasmic protein TonB [Rickettsiales bacterium Ac37b]|nr:Periplasmic protein TonB [Rickettsiales bacterium Ac37b]